MKGKEGSRGKKSKSGKKSKICAVLVSLLFCTNISFAEFNINVPAVPTEKQGSGKEMFLYECYGKGETTPAGEKSVNGYSSELIKTIIEGSYAWNLFINNKEQNEKILIEISRENDENAGAMGYYVEVYKKGSKTETEDYKMTSTNARINGRNFKLSDKQEEIFEATDKKYDGIVTIGQAFGTSKGGTFCFDTSAVALYQNDFDPVMNSVQHELGHALGIISNAGKKAADPKNSYFSEPEIDAGGKINKDKSEKLAIWDKYLRIDNNNNIIAPDRGMIVISDKTQKAEDYGVNKDYVFDISRNAPYFAGPKTMQIVSGVSDEEIKGKTEEQIIEYCQEKIKKNGGIIHYSDTYTESGTKEATKVNGLPIHPFDEPDSIDLSHTELRNSYMSHQNFRNWTTFMEAELSSLADIGYDIDLKQYFGKSFYLDKITADVDTSNFATRDFTKDYAIGVHVYGEKNNITQVGYISATGSGSFGVRVDGINDEYMLGKNDNSNTANITVSGSRIFRFCNRREQYSRKF